MSAAKSPPPGTVGERMHRHSLSVDRIDQHVLVNHQFPTPPQLGLAAHVRIFLQQIDGFQDPVDDPGCGIGIILRDVVVHCRELSQRTVRQWLLHSPYRGSRALPSLRSFNQSRASAVETERPEA